MSLTPPNPFDILNQPIKYSLNHLTLRKKYHNMVRKAYESNKPMINEMLININWAYNLLKDDYERANWLMKHNKISNKKYKQNVLTNKDYDEFLALSENTDRNELQTLLMECSSNWNNPYYLQRWKFLKNIDKRTDIID